MPRKARSYKKHIPEPDPRYGSVKYAKFINYLMERGKKNTARKIFYDAFDIVQEKLKDQLGSPSPSSSAKPSALTSVAADKPASAKIIDAKPPVKPSPTEGHTTGITKAKAMDARQVFDLALKNVCPLMELKSRRIGGANYQVPMEVSEPRRTTLGMRWLIKAAQSKKGMPMKEKLALEIIDAFNKTGAAIKKREDVHRMAEANKAFAHFARFGNRRR